MRIQDLRAAEGSRLKALGNYPELRAQSLEPIRGQAVVEYAILIGVIMAALVAIQTYAKRGLQAGIKIAADEIGSQSQGLVDIDLNVAPQELRHEKGDAQVTAKRHAADNPLNPATRILESRAEGERISRTNEATTSSGFLSLHIGVEPGQ